jgi:radical SAM protein with 4Fe4S-binding SPASM domain
MKQHQKLSNLIQGLHKIPITRNYKFNFDMLPLEVERITMAQRINLIKTGFNLLKIPVKPYSYPPYCSIELTNYCNLKCPICPTGAGTIKRKPQAMEVSLFEKAWEELSPTLLVACLWNWGEPLLHPELRSILKITSKSNVATLISTNGQNLDDKKVIRALVDYPPKVLIVALDGITDETNSKFRVRAKLAPALEGVKMLVKKRKGKYPILHWRFIVMRHNEHELPELDEFAKLNKFDSYSIRTLSLTEGKSKKHNILKPDNPKYQAYQYKGKAKMKRNDYLCDKIVSFPCVMVNGDVTPCEQDVNASIKYGNIQDESFKDIWWGIKAQEIRHQILTDMDKVRFCKGCCFRDRPLNTCSIEYQEVKQIEDNIRRAVILAHK